MNGNFSNIEKGAILQDKNNEIYLEDIPLTDKTFNALNNAGFETISDISKLFYSGQLGTIKGIGKKQKNSKKFSRIDLMLSKKRK